MFAGDHDMEWLNLTPHNVVALPLAGLALLSPRPFRKSFWTVFFDPLTADIVAFTPLDSF